MDRRLFVAGAGATIVAGPAQASVAVDRFGSSASVGSVILLYGSDGLTNSGRYQFAANMIAGAGYNVLLPRYFEATGDQRARYGETKSKFPVWLEAIETITGDQQPRFAVVGFSLGGALALALAARDRRIKAVVDFFGFLPPGRKELLCPRRLFCMGMRIAWCRCPTPEPSRDWSKAMGALSGAISIPAKDMACLWRVGPMRSRGHKHSCASTSDDRVGGAFVEDRDL
jgi:carboxymethylenebutenolidase